VFETIILAVSNNPKFKHSNIHFFQLFEQACVAADALLLVLGYSPLTFKYVRPTGHRR
jgi:hypothetical protein